MRIYEDLVLVFKNWAVLAQFVGSVSTRENEKNISFSRVETEPGIYTAEIGEWKSINGNGVY